MHTLPKWRLYLLRALYLLTFLGVGPSVWGNLFAGGGWQPLEGVALAFWCALSLLALLGVLYPLQLLPLLILQFGYKIIWLIGAGLPMWQAGTLTDYGQELAIANGVGVLLDLLIVPWAYVLAQFTSDSRREKAQT